MHKESLKYYDKWLADPKASPQVPEMSARFKKCPPGVSNIQVYVPYTELKKEPGNRITFSKNVLATQRILIVLGHR